MKPKPSGSAPRPAKSTKAPAPPVAKFNEREQLALAKALRAKRKAPPQDLDNDKASEAEE